MRNSKSANLFTYNNLEISFISLEKPIDISLQKPIDPCRSTNLPLDTNFQLPRSRILSN